MGQNLRASRKRAALFGVAALLCFVFQGAMAGACPRGQECAARADDAHACCPEKGQPDPSPRSSGCLDSACCKVTPAPPGKVSEPLPAMTSVTPAPDTFQFLEAAFALPSESPAPGSPPRSLFLLNSVFRI